MIAIRRAGAAVALSLALSGAAKADADLLDGLVRAAFFTPECLSRAAALDVAGPADADALFARFAAAARTPLAPGEASRRDGDLCASPVVSLINLFRLNGVASELAFAADATGAIGRVLVHVPGLGRHLDPSQPAAAQAAIDARFRAEKSRVYLDASRMAVVGRLPGRSDAAVPAGGPAPVRVRTVPVPR